MKSSLALAFLFETINIAIARPSQSKSEFSIVQQRAWSKFHPNGAEGLRWLYTKYGVNPPRHLERRGQQGTVANQPYGTGQDDYPESRYVETIMIGSPPQSVPVSLDTGSSDLWVMSSSTPLDGNKRNRTYFNPSKSSTSKKVSNESWLMSYGDGSTASGDLYTDVVSVAGVTYRKQAVEVANFISEGLQDNPHFEGYLGMGHDAGNQVTPKKQKTFFSNIVSTLSAPLFTASLNHLNPGSYDFGFIDHTKYTGELSFHPSLPPPVNQSWWVVNATSMSVGSNTTKTPFRGGLKAIVDTGASFVLLPKKYVDLYFSNAPFARYDPYTGYTFPCNETLPDLTLQIGCYETTIPGKLMVGASVNETTCYTALAATVPGEYNPDAVFGDSFLKTTFTVFKHPPGGEPSLGFAQKPVDSSFPKNPKKRSL